jgi:adenine/guanine phosphoribosyltransferase-like PRPP-binding protein
MPVRGGTSLGVIDMLSMVFADVVNCCVVVEFGVETRAG